MHPFDLRAAIMAKHAQHVVLIHFPIGLFMIAVLFDCIAQATGKAAILWAAYYNFLAAAISAPIALVTGILAWQLEAPARNSSVALGSGHTLSATDLPRLV